MKKKAKLNGRRDARSVAFQPVPREFDLIRNRRVRDLKSLGFSDSQIADGVLGDRPLVAIVARGIHETQASFAKRRKKLSLLRASKREKKFIELASYSLAAAIEGKRLWINGEYGLSFKLGFVMAANEALMWRSDIETKKRAEGAKSAATYTPPEWRWFMELGSNFVAAEEGAGRRRPTVKQIYHHICDVSEGRIATIGGLGRDVKGPIAYTTFAARWSEWTGK